MNDGCYLGTFGHAGCSSVVMQWMDGWMDVGGWCLGLSLISVGKEFGTLTGQAQGQTAAAAVGGPSDDEEPPPQ